MKATSRNSVERMIGASQHFLKLRCDRSWYRRTLIRPRFFCLVGSIPTIATWSWFLIMVVQFNGRISQNQNVSCRMEINGKNQISMSSRRWWFDPIYHRNRKTHSNFFIYKNWVLCFFNVFRKLSGHHLNGCRMLL